MLPWQLAEMIQVYLIFYILFQLNKEKYCNQKIILSGENILSNSAKVNLKFNNKHNFIFKAVSYNTNNAYFFPFWKWDWHGG